MPRYEVRIFEPPSGVRDCRVAAASAQAAIASLHVTPMQVLRVRQLRDAGPARTVRLVLRLFSQELAQLLDAGIPLLEAVETLREKDPSSAPSPVLARVAAALQAGRPLSAALADDPAAFDPLFVAIVAASERSGHLPAALRHHAAYLAWSDALRARLVAAAVYPTLLLASGAAVVLFLLFYVLPRFAGIVDGLGSDLPAASRMLIDIGVWAAAHPQRVLAAFAIPAALLVLVAASPGLRRQVSQAAFDLLLRSPGLGPRLRTVVLARLYRALGLLLAAGVPVLQALRLLHGVLPATLRASLQAATTQVDAGQRLSQALRNQGLATPVALRMLRVGEGSGSLAPMLERAAAFHDDEIARTADLVTRAVNPLLMLLMGLVIGGIVVLMYLPIFSLMDQVQ